MAKEFTYYGKSWEEVQKLSTEDFAKLLPSRLRRVIKRGFTEAQKKFLKNLAKGQPNLETHCRDLVILPSFVGKVIKVHNGKEFMPIAIEKDMLGHRLGEFSISTKKVEHSAPGIGATRSSSALSVR
ncbi:30S ribosomal protein S19 [Candidatus Woesearchaeota archaeon]|nr:30S ribosomal protein S19 [Candidatus Woesearchaeota archaeon]